MAQILHVPIQIRVSDSSAIVSSLFVLLVAVLVPSSWSDSNLLTLRSFGQLMPFQRTIDSTHLISLKAKMRASSNCNLTKHMKHPVMSFVKTVLLPCILLAESSLVIYTNARMAPKLSPLVVSPGGTRAFSEFIRRGHSHNDYHQENPLSSALKHGLNSVEVDVFPRDGTLLVAHTVFELDKGRTIENMYIAPILTMLRLSGMATSDPRVTVEEDSRPFPQAVQAHRRGLTLFDFGTHSDRNSPLDHEENALTLLVDFKADAEKSVSLLHKALEPLQPYLSKIDQNGKLRKGKLTVIVSGNRPRPESLTARDGSGDRYIFIDGRSHDIHSQTDSMLVPMVSLPWRKLQLARLIGRGDRYMRKMAQKAHEQGKRVRIWGAPNRESLWTQMVKNNVDLLSIDDHHKFARFASQGAYITRMR